MKHDPPDRRRLVALTLLVCRLWIGHLDRTTVSGPTAVA